MLISSKDILTNTHNHVWTSVQESYGPANVGHKINPHSHVHGDRRQGEGSHMPHSGLCRDTQLLYSLTMQILFFQFTQAEVDSEESCNCPMAPQLIVGSVLTESIAFLPTHSNCGLVYQPLCTMPLCFFSSHTFMACLQVIFSYFSF